MKIIGIVPARMGSSRFPGKPMYPILGRPMIEHVFLRAKFFPHWSGLYIATCDNEIYDYSAKRDWPVLMTSDKHTRCLDRVAEAVTKCEQNVDDEDIIVCVQGDEPMLSPDMISAAVEPLNKDKTVKCTVLSMDIEDDGQFRDPNTVKIVNDLQGNVLYTSRAPIPHCKILTKSVGAKRIYGIFAFRWETLRKFNEIPESPLELVESCDSNRICDNGYAYFRQRIAPFPYRQSFSVDAPSDIHLVEKHMSQDPIYGRY